jgi:hypothetical protein
MKTLLVPMLAGVAAAAFAFNLGATDALNSPKAGDSQNRIAPALASEPNLAAQNQNATVSPRRTELPVKASPALPETRDLAVGACSAGSPKAAKQASASCCKPAPATCTTPKACCASK